MREELLSVGIDIGTTTTQLVFSRLTLENRGNAFSVPEIAITSREVIYRSPIHFTPLRSATEIDGPGVREIVAAEYEKAGVERSAVDTGAVIITGETARKENARQVLEELAGFAGDFVVSTAGPDLESILAARGAGAQSASQEKSGLLLHMDIGGGTSNLALYQEGQLRGTGCLDVGGRVVRLDRSGRIDAITPKVAALFPKLELGQAATEELLWPVAEELARALECAAGLQPFDGRTRTLITHKTVSLSAPPRYVTFSGGVADAIWGEEADWKKYGDIGILLGRAIRGSRLMSQCTPLKLKETIRATVIGAGTQTTELSGSTVYYRQVELPLCSLPVLRLEGEECAPGRLAKTLLEKGRWLGDSAGEGQIALSLPGERSPSFQRLQQLAEELAEGFRGLKMLPVVALEQDMAKALGQALALRMEGPVLCLDGIRAENGDYLDVGEPVGGGAALPVVVKTIAFA